MRYSEDGKPDNWAWMVTDSHARISALADPDPRLPEKPFLIWKITQLLCRLLRPERYLEAENPGRCAWLVPDDKAFIEPDTIHLEWSRRHLPDEEADAGIVEDAPSFDARARISSLAD